jgi:hypothetical protein
MTLEQIIKLAEQFLIPAGSRISTELKESIEYFAAALTDPLEARIAVMNHDFPILQEFHAKHGLPSKTIVSCLCCGHVHEEIAISHMELPNIVICRECHSGALANKSDWITKHDAEVRRKTLEEAEELFKYSDNTDYLRGELSRMAQGAKE